MFAVILFFSYVSSEPMITPITHSPGIYFDPITKIYFYNDYWRVITHLNTVSLEPQLDKVDRLIVKTSLVCAKLQPEEYSSCKNVFSPIEVLLESNYLKAQSLSHIISSENPARFKRSLEFGGEILKFFFGTLDAEDARKYDAAISSCQRSESEIFHLMKDNIHIVKSSINTFNSTISRLNQNEIKLNSQINKLNDILSYVTSDNEKLMYLTRFNSLVNIIESSLLAISNFLDTVINAILFSKVNVLHPSVLSPVKLYDELSKHRNSINKGLDFPVALSIENIHTIIDISKLVSYFYNNKIVFVIQIPLVSPVKYNVYKTIPLPTPHYEGQSKSFALIKPTKPYLAITDDRLNYVLLDTLRDCTILNSENSICKLESIYSVNSNPSCETKLLTEVTLSLPRECEPKILYGLIDIWHKLKNNQWIFVQSKTSKLTINCNDNFKDYSISGTGILKLNKGCIGYFKTIQFIPSTISNLTIDNNNFNINFDITNDNCCNQEIVNKTIPLLSPINLSNINLDSLKNSINQFNDLELQINRIQEESHFIKYSSYYSAFTYIIISLIFLFLCYKIIRCFKQRNCNKFCIQFFFQCDRKKISHKENKAQSSIEMSQITDDEDNASVDLRNLSASVQEIFK
ncbi:uncharacterized protein [Maniola hyperantus]|uniref:uncharacterized protein n=1 Tax=Aphantopus hyperantus TaxID=2795564 RepID=UPI003749D771